MVSYFHRILPYIRLPQSSHAGHGQAVAWAPHRGPGPGPWARAQWPGPGSWARAERPGHGLGTLWKRYTVSEILVVGVRAQKSRHPYGNYDLPYDNYDLPCNNRRRHAACHRRTPYKMQIPTFCVHPHLEKKHPEFFKNSVDNLRKWCPKPSKSTP